jgi:hypothetical protein
MEEFIKGASYYFVGDLALVENNLIDIKYLSNNYIFLGKFIEYVGYVYGFDWMQDAKAKFEFGILSKSYYDKIKPLG